MDEIEKLKADLSAKETELATTKGALASAEATTASTVEELKDLRKKKQEAEAERDIAKAKLAEATGGESPSDIVKRELDAREAKEVERTKGDTLTSFKESHKDLFDESNDPGGLKFKAFEASLNKLNLSGLKTAKEFSQAYEDALVLMNRGAAPKERPFNGNPHVPAGGGAPKTSEGEGEVSSDEKSLIESIGMSEERYLKLKKSKPAYVSALLRDHLNR